MPLDEGIKSFKKSVDQGLAPMEGFPYLEVWSRSDGRVKSQRFDPSKGFLIERIKDDEFSLEESSAKDETFAVQVDEGLLIQVATQEQAEKLAAVLVYAKKGLGTVDELRKRIADLEQLVAAHEKKDQAPVATPEMATPPTADLLSTGEDEPSGRPAEPAKAAPKSGLAPKPK
ncbi:hypothetical protein GCM10023213_19940 [Prosthecobacter algae]|uniref:Uncharacterized protein n=1 Tax=Prosthecobacter algae TaxID=1144682 RepID=A0ABP9P5H1_9BACT